MNILIMTNTYKPLVGGLEKSIEFFAHEYRRRGHRVVIVVPAYPDAKPERDVIRIPAMANFRGTNFSLQLPIPGVLDEALGDFRPNIVHSQHPFLVGDTALRAASKYNVPLVFTHHTLYEENVHYLPGNEEALKRFVVELATGYANLADCVFAPSASVMSMLADRGVRTRIEIIPTGLYLKDFACGAGKMLRKKLGLAPGAFVIGYIGRLAPEKNLEFLAQAVAAFMHKHPDVYFLVGGQGPSEGPLQDIFQSRGLGGRLVMPGVFKGKALADAYHALNVFVFASQSETQGLVLEEAMASGVPVVAVDAPGVRDIVEDGINGRLLMHESVQEFVGGLEWIKHLNTADLKNVKTACRRTAAHLSMDKCAEKALNVYRSLSVRGFLRRPVEQSYWDSKLRLIQAQWALMKNLTKAAGAMFGLVETAL